jgi:hypothetical protein
MDVLHLEPELFDRFWKPHRNILMLEVADRVDTQTPSFAFYRNKYSRGQIYMVAKARTAEALAEVLASRSGEMMSLLHAEEAQRFADIVALSPNEVLAREVAQKWAIQGLYPKDARKAKEMQEFWWMDRQLTRFKGGDNHDIQQGFFIHSEPYTSPDQLSLEHVLDSRDALTKRYVPGPTPGSYMATERKYFPSYEESEFKGISRWKYGVCGRWKTTSWVAPSTASRSWTSQGDVCSPWKDMPTLLTSTSDPTSENWRGSSSNPRCCRQGRCPWTMSFWVVRFPTG